MKKATEWLPLSDFEELQITYETAEDNWKEEPYLPLITERLTILKSVVINLSNEPINILPLLSQKQKNDIISNLSYE